MFFGRLVIVIELFNFKFVMLILICLGNLFGVVDMIIVYKFWVNILFDLILIDLLIRMIFVLIFVFFDMLIDRNFVCLKWLVKVFVWILWINVLIFCLLMFIVIIVFVLCLCNNLFSVKLLNEIGVFFILYL